MSSVVVAGHLKQFKLTDIEEAKAFLRHKAVALTDSFLQAGEFLPGSPAHAADVGTAYYSIQVIVQCFEPNHQPSAMMEVAAGETPMAIAYFYKHLGAN